MEDFNNQKQRPPNPREGAFPLSSVTFCFTIPFFKRGFKNHLEEDDLPQTWKDHQSSALGDKIEEAWRNEENRAAALKITPSLRRVVLKMFGPNFMLLGIVLAFCELMWVIQPNFLGLYLGYYVPGQTHTTKQQAYLYALGIVMCSLINTLTYHPYLNGIIHLGMKMRVACCSLIYRKALKLSKKSVGETATGQIVNLLSNDVGRFDVTLLYAQYIWVGPLETAICAYMMYKRVGISAVIGVAVILSFIPWQIYLSKKMSDYRLKTALKTDERVKLMSEILAGMHVIKMYAWEKPFSRLVAYARRLEIDCNKVSSFLRGVTQSFYMFTTSLAIFSSIVTYAALGNYLTPEKVFVLFAFYNFLRISMTLFFPQALPRVAELNVSLNRINEFLLREETAINALPDPKTFIDPFRKGNNSEKITEEKKNSLIQMSEVNATWSANLKENTLANISLSIHPACLLAVIGPVGCGKSSLFNVILKELPIKAGKLLIEGKISYASQDPWLFAGTVRQNILFGLPMDTIRYKTVIKKCALSRDFHLLPYGDKTIIGDRGISLSGGQRARINLARAIYKDADIYLLDDPLSAVDTHVGKQLFEDCINDFLREKLVILVTHQMQYLKDVGEIIYLDNGSIRAKGTYSELSDKGFEFTKMLKDDKNEEDDATESDYKRKMSVISSASIEISSLQERFKEQKGKGAVDFLVYKSYFRAGGKCWVIILLFFLFFLTQVFASAADYFLSYWINLQEIENTKSNNTLHANIKNRNGYGKGFWDFSNVTSMEIYSVLISLLLIFTFIRLKTFVVVTMKASIRLHDSMFSSISRAAMRFFNINSVGRILNRFSKDMGAVDEMLPAAMLDTFQILISFLSITVIVSIVNHWLMIPTVLLLLILYSLRIIYVRTSRDLKRLEGTTRSPVFAHLAATIQGLTTIRAFGANTILTNEFDKHQDLHSAAWHTFHVTTMAFGYWLDLICVLYVSIVTFSFLLIGTEKFGGNVGLAITQVTGMTHIFQWGMKQSAELENQMTAVERVVEYTEIEPERDSKPSLDKRTPKYWPNEGKICFRNVSLRYSPSDPPVLKNLSFTIKPAEKVGIVGRTGAGKSSIINAIFQMTETFGKIFIDDIDISTVPLSILRSKVSIIPQEPVIFTGTMRYNLDPFAQHSDEDLWRVLQEVELRDSLAALEGLDTKMQGGGANFSVGQRQLVCLARAILLRNKILILDEATANVDPQTDALIQSTIRKKFDNCTVLTVAHRLHTIMDSDRIMVMDAGMLEEFDHPYVLLQNKRGIFYQMVEQTGKSMEDLLHQMARESYYKNC